MQKQYIVIRNIQKSDILLMQEIVKRIYPHLPYMATDFVKDTVDVWSNAGIKPCFVVFEENGIITGFGGYKEITMTYDAYQIYWMMIEPTKQRTGIGTAILNQILLEIKNIKGRYVILHGAVPDFYTKFGFRKIDELYNMPIMSLKV